MRRLFSVSILLTALLALAVAVAASAARQDTKLTLVAYSTPKEAFGKLIPAFQSTAPGNGISFDQSYGASGDQARAVINGLKADVVFLSLEPDMTSLVQSKLVARSWNTNEYKGILTRSVVCFVVREGNPKKIRTWDDLIKPGVQVVTPNPFTSGGAKWNIMAGYGAMLREKKSPKQAEAYLRTLFKQHVVSLDKSARDALTTFNSGRGDVLLTYENEALFANSKGVRMDYYIPKATLRIDNPVAVTTNSSSPAAAKAFVKYLYSVPGQRIFAQNGYRPVVKAATKGFAFPVRPQMFTIDYLGGWAKVDKKFFDPNTGVMARIIGQQG
jgi:sulfate transport system substrate-binding protein